MTLRDIKGTSPLIVHHRIHLEDNSKPYYDHLRCFNPTFKEVVSKEVLKWLDHEIIYPIFDNDWINPILVVPDKTGITISRNDKNELVSTPVTVWMACLH